MVWIVFFRFFVELVVSFELVYNILKGPNIPIFFAIDASAPLKTTLLKELDGYFGAKVKYKIIKNGIENIDKDIDFLEFINKI